MGVEVRRRGKSYHVDYSVGRRHQVRGSLGTRNCAAARTVQNRLELAIAQGPQSTIWSELRPVLPPDTFRRFVGHFGLPEMRFATWRELRDQFEAYKQQQVSMNRHSIRTVKNYKRSLDSFECFLNEQKITLVAGINKSVLGRFATWQLARVTQREQTGAATLEAALFHLHHLFAFAIDQEMIYKNPVTPPKKRFDETKGSQPYSADELAALEAAAKPRPYGLFEIDCDWLPFLLARWTGLRREDLISITWESVLFRSREIDHHCRKNKKRAVLPIKDQLYDALEAEYERRNPDPTETILLNPRTEAPYTEGQIYDFFRRLGKRANVHAHPHRFRDTFAVDMLIRYKDVYKVAKFLGDDVDVVMRHYVPYVPELRKDAVDWIDKSVGIEQYATPASQKFPALP